MVRLTAGTSSPQNIITSIGEQNATSEKKALEHKKEIANRLGRPLIQTNFYEDDTTFEKQSALFALVVSAMEPWLPATWSSRVTFIVDDFHSAIEEYDFNSEIGTKNTILSMRDSAYGTSVALATYGRVLKTHTALTSECGSMLEEVLAITEDLHDVHNLGKDAAGVHHSLMENLSKANTILLPLETALSKDVAAMTDALAREGDTKMEISPIHGQAIYQSYYLRIRDAFQTLRPLVPSLALSVKGLYSLLIKLAQIASFHAGNLHKALEGLGESQEVKSQGIDQSSADLTADATEFDDKERENLPASNSGNTKEFPAFAGTSLDDNEWLSPPNSICSSGSESDITSPEASFPGEEMGQLSQDLGRRESPAYQDSVHVAQIDYEEIPLFGKSQPVAEIDETYTGLFNSAANEPSEHQKTIASPSDRKLAAPDALHSSSKSTEENFGGSDEKASLNKVKIKDEDCESLFPNTSAAARAGRDKNPYVMSVLRRVEMKLDGQDISDNSLIYCH
ncbi:hypothetical protein F8388_008605 [Cannabis sativa]|uniref:Uncharacterized protein n=1 Tax=Cannabis sativa TaxID=3483 RepID=A0A7J6FM03_CANSA|nr:hypothetical protein F8388_008605 [Cannabis sativa]